MITLKDNDLVFAKIRPSAKIPTKDKENAGYDIYACFEEEYIIIPSFTTKLIPTGIAAATSEKYYLQVHERGSTGSKGMKYGAGVIDSSYRGEIFICINNVTDKDIFISKSDNTNVEGIYYPYEKAIAQLVVHEVPVMEVREIPYTSLLEIPSKRGTGALGSSGK